MVRELIPPANDTGADRLAAIRLALTTWDAAGGGGGIGSVAGEVFGLLFGSSYERRRNEWMTSVALHLMNLLRRTGQIELDLQRLQTDEQFLSTLVTASRIAAATHSQEKLEALRNAVVNVATGFPIDEIQRQIFLRYIDELTERHLMVLASNRNSVKGWQPAEISKDVLTGLIWKDLANRGLFKESAFRVGARGIDVQSPPITLLGKRFLKFIETPTPEI